MESETININVTDWTLYINDNPILHANEGEICLEEEVPVLTPSEDPMNSCQTRNENNMPIMKYNCGGFALGTYSWYQVNHGDNFDLEEDLFYNSTLNDDEVREEILKNNIDYLLDDFEGDLRLLDSADDEIEDDEELIAYRICCYMDEFENIVDDFHFRVKRNGKWYEKQGSSEPCECEFSEDPWTDGSALWYGSRIAYFAYRVS